MFHKFIFNTIANSTAKCVNSIALFIFIAVVSLPSSASTLAQEKKALTAIQANISSLQTNIIKIESSIKSTEAEIKKQYITLAPLRKKLDKADATLIGARAASTQNPTDANKAKTSNAEFKYVLAERKYKKAEVKLAKAEARLEKLQKQKVNTAKKLSTQRKSLNEQKRKVKEWKPKQPKREITARKPAPIRTPQSAVRNAPRVKDLPRTRELPRARELPIAKTYPVTKNQSAPVTKSPTRQARQQNEVLQLAENTLQKTPSATQRPLSKVKAATVVATAVAAKPKGPIEPEEQREKRSDKALRDKERLEDLIDSTNKRKKSAYRDEVMVVKTTQTNGKTRRFNVKLEHIKEQRYIAQIQVSTGKMVLKAANSKWTTLVPAWDNGKTYQFIYDGREGIGPVMTWYRTDLAR